MALSAVIEDLHERLEAAGWGQTRPLWGFVLLSLRDGPLAWGLVEVYRVEPAGFAPAELERAARVVRDAGKRLEAILEARRLG